MNSSDVKVLIVSSKSKEQEVRRIISKHSASASEEMGHIVILLRNDNLTSYKVENSQRINSRAPKESAARILLLGSIPNFENFGSGTDFRACNEFKEINQFEKAFPKILHQSGLDWKSALISQLQLWSHGYIDESHIDRWLNQFTRLGNQWIGEQILRNIDFWSASRIRDSLNLSEEIIKPYSHICFKRGEAGKSGDVLANILKKQISNYSVQPHFSDFITICTENQDRDNFPILFVEDCLLTGTEMVKYLKKILGKENDRNAKSNIKPLNNPDWLIKNEIEFRFAIGTDLGIYRLERFISHHGLQARVKCGTVLDILTSEGKDAITQNRFDHTLYEGAPSNPDLFIRKSAFFSHDPQSPKGLRMINFCKEIGRQLFTNYLQSQQWIWSAEKIEMCGLGMNSFGLGLVFSHSIPKSTLPLFWGSGAVKFKGSSTNWIPLFSG